MYPTLCHVDKTFVLTFILANKYSGSGLLVWTFKRHHEVDRDCIADLGKLCVC